MAKIKTEQADAPELLDASQVLQAAPADPGAVETTNPVSVRVLCAVTIGDVHYLPGDVIEGVPAAVVEAYQGSLDAHPDAVGHALSFGAQAKQYA